jgi:hypothetical protein
MDSGSSSDQPLSVHSKIIPDFKVYHQSAQDDSLALKKNHKGQNFFILKRIK